MPLVLLIVVAVAGSVAGVAIVLRSVRAVSRTAPPGLQAGLPRVQAVLHTGPEGALIGVQRELGVPLGGRDVPYGGLYLESAADYRLLVRTRSEIGRGLLAVLVVRRLQSRSSALEFSIVRLPDDEELHEAVLALELRLILAIRRVDRQAEVRFTGTAPRDLLRHGTDAAV